MDSTLEAQLDPYQPVIPIGGENPPFYEYCNETPNQAFILCPYQSMMTTMKKICSANVIVASMNPTYIIEAFSNVNLDYQVIIRVEGVVDNSYLRASSTLKAGNTSWVSLLGFSTGLKKQIVDSKLDLFAKTLVYRDSVLSWFREHPAMPKTLRRQMASDPTMFWKNMLQNNREDIQDFIRHCSEEKIERYIKLVEIEGSRIIHKHREEVKAKLDKAYRSANFIEVKFPIINRVYINQKYAKECAKTWPGIKFTSIDSAKALNIFD